MATSDRLAVLDTLGEVPEDKLFQFFLQYVQPAFENWWASEKQASKHSRGGFRVLQDEGPAPAKAVKRPQPTMVRPEAQIRPVICPQCGGQISWNIEQALEGFCPYCNTFLQLTP